MLKLEVMNELSLKVTSQGGGDVLFTKAGAFICGQSQGGKNYQFEKVLLGPQGNPLQAALGQLGRRFTGENLPLMKVKFGGPSELYFANEEQHVTVFQLGYGEKLSVESESILAFTSDCKYGVRFLASGVISQKGLATSTLVGNGPNAYAAVLCDGNPLIMNNTQTGGTIEVDPDAMVCFMGGDPGFKLDLSWKNLIGQASGESYMMEWGGNNPAIVMVQPHERTSGLDISMDGRRTGQQASRQQNQTVGQAVGGVGQAAQQVGGVISSAGGALQGNGTGMGNAGGGAAGGLMGAIGQMLGGGGNGGGLF